MAGPIQVGLPYFSWLLLVGCFAVVCIAPKGAGTAAAVAAMRASQAGTSTLPGVAAAAAITTAALAASWALKKRAAVAVPAHFLAAPAAARNTKTAKDGRSSRGMPLSAVMQPSAEAHVPSDEDASDEDESWNSDNEWEFEDEDDVCSGDEDVQCEAGSSTAPTSSSGKLWTKKQFPAGVESCNNWRMENLVAVQEWKCPCTDRQNCIGADRLCILQLYEHRQRFREGAGSGGMRDALRDELQGHYDETHGKFSRSFVVGSLGDCCAESAALAKGVSFQTFATARADVRRNRPRRAARQEGRHRKESEQRAHIRAWIRSQVQGRSEGPKGGADPLDKWRTGYLPRSKRYEVYKEAQRRAGQPILCSSALLYQRRCPLLALVRLSACGVVHIACSAPSQPLRTPLPRSNKVWAAELKAGTIKEEKACGHGKCTRCSEIQTDKDRYRGRMDAEGKRLYAQALAEEATHAEEHGGERDYAEDWWDAAQRNPEAVTAFSMDAPTERQFDIPVQPRKARDTVKALENAKRWSSKITGLMISGIGILAYVTRDGLGSGGDLSCTVLYLAMCAMIAGGRKLGQRFNVLLDNTSGDNKNNEVIAFLAWLVAKDIVTEASTFFMMVDHTYCRIDQSFRALIGHLLSAAVYTPRRLVQSIFTYLQAYNCLGVSELHCIWLYGIGRHSLSRTCTHSSRASAPDNSGRVCMSLSCEKIDTVRCDFGCGSLHKRHRGSRMDMAILFLKAFQMGLHPSEPLRPTDNGSELKCRATSGLGFDLFRSSRLSSGRCRQSGSSGLRACLAMEISALFQRRCICRGWSCPRLHPIAPCRR